MRRTNNCHLLAAATLAAAAVVPTAARAGGCTVPFVITTAANLPSVSNLAVQCEGPWDRSSSSKPIGPFMTKVPFYCADQTIFSMWGSWSCAISYNIGSTDYYGPQVDFCIESTGPAEVDLYYDGGEARGQR